MINIKIESMTTRLGKPPKDQSNRRIKRAAGRMRLPASHRRNSVRPNDGLDYPESCYQLANIRNSISLNPDNKIN